MGPAFYVMAILGCGEAEGACEPVSTLATRYESQEACNAATSSAIEKHSDLLYPVVVAQCRPANSPASAQVWADEVKLPTSHQAPRIQRASFKPTRARS
ncbi:MAG TPA: hypothetical protein VK391_09015 [Allosphingosinicella sp.]|nr:hypothetical protein [Allosphingosinicella sp.]